MALKRRRDLRMVILTALTAVAMAFMLLVGSSKSDAKSSEKRTADLGKQFAEKLLGVLPGEQSAGHWKVFDRKALLSQKGQGTIGQTETRRFAAGDKISAPNAVTASLCINGAITVADASYDHPDNATLACNPTLTNANRDHYLLTIGGCQTFPTSVTITTCGPAGCTFVPFASGGIRDTVIAVYRKGGATAGTASGSGFNPSDPCGSSSSPQRLVGLSDDAGCGDTGGLSSVTLSLGPGDFDVVVSGFDPATFAQSAGSYNLSVVAAAAGCTATLQPTAADGQVRGRIVDSDGAGVSGAVVELSGTQARKTITDANGNYLLENVETNGFYTVRPSRANFDFSPAERSFSQVSNNTEATFTAVSHDKVGNPLDTPEYFVRQHYLDFLGREPDEAGFNFWSDQILECGTDTNCIERRRENVSAAYFLSIEFQKTGGLVDGLYKASYGVRPQFAEFMPDTRALAVGVVVGKEGWEELLETNKQAFMNAFVNRPAFHAAYDGLSSSDFVDALISHTGVSFTGGERDALLSGLTMGTMTRADVLRSVAENNSFVNAKFNETFVMMEYFGYLRRDPDTNGYAFWLNKLNEFKGNFERAEMVKAFIVSGEFRDRFPSQGP